jgi:hypothetical protein
VIKAQRIVRATCMVFPLAPSRILSWMSSSKLTPSLCWASEAARIRAAGGPGLMSALALCAWKQDGGGDVMDVEGVGATTGGGKRKRREVSTPPFMMPVHDIGASDNLTCRSLLDAPGRLTCR